MLHSKTNRGNDLFFKHKSPEGSPGITWLTKKDFTFPLENYIEENLKELHIVKSDESLKGRVFKTGRILSGFVKRISEISNKPNP